MAWSKKLILWTSKRDHRNEAFAISPLQKSSRVYQLRKNLPKKLEMGGKEQAKEAGQKFELPTDRLPDAEEVARYIKDRPELERPLIFPNHQKQFIAFTWLSCAGLVELVFLNWLS